MKIESLSLRTRLGRRVFFLFVICALLPIAITCALAVVHLSNVSRERQAYRLKEFSETYGLGVLQRLEAADVAIGLIRGARSNLPPPHAAARTQLDKGQSWLAHELGAPNSVPAIFIVAKAPRAGAGALQYFVLDPHFVFGDSTHLPYQLGLRVHALDGRTLYWVEPLARHGQKARLDEDTLATEAWELFLSARFASESWVVEASQPRLTFSDGCAMSSPGPSAPPSSSCCS